MIWKGFKETRATIEIDVTKPIEELWNNLDKDARWGVNKAKKEGLVITEANEHEAKEFYKIYSRMCKEKRIKMHSFEELHKPLNNPELIGKIFVCKKWEKVIAGTSVVETGSIKTVCLYTNASLPDYLKFQPNNLLYWSLIEYTKNKGFELFDLGGYDEDAKPGTKMYELNRFKQRWNGVLVHRESYSKNIFYIIGKKVVKKCPFTKRLLNRGKF